jgi:hypothetical protein
MIEKFSKKKKKFFFAFVLMMKFNIFLNGNCEKNFISHLKKVINEVR